LNKQTGQEEDSNTHEQTIESTEQTLVSLRVKQKYVLLSPASNQSATAAALSEYVPVPGPVGAGLGGRAIADKELPSGGFELHTRVLGRDGRVHVHHPLFSRRQLELQRIIAAESTGGEG
jgi:hypothetical protein